MSTKGILRCLDSSAMAEKAQRELGLRPELAQSLGRSAVEAIELGYYLADHIKVEWGDAVRAACEAKVSIAPDAELPAWDGETCEEPRILWGQRLAPPMAE